MIQGDVDRCNPLSESQDQTRHFTGSYKRALLKDVGHFPAREAPEQVAQDILAHLQSYV
jgi:pimeloyl-ACP methyl ester carboxylesterase